MRHFAVSALGRDRPGIVAAITSVLAEHGVNIEDSQMGILRGHFSMTLLVALADGVDAEQLRSDLAAVGEELALEAVSMQPVEEVEVAPHEPSHVVTVYGVDHPGILAAVCGALAGAGVNITDLSTRLLGEPDSAVYVVVMEVAAGDRSEAEVRTLLEPVAREQAVELAVHEAEADRL